MKILVCVPTYETIEPDTFKSIYGLDSAGHVVLFNFRRGYDCARARNEIARETLCDGYDAVLMVDSDIVLPSDAIASLTDPLADICLGVYPRKGTQTRQSELFHPGYENFSDENNISMDEIAMSWKQGEKRIGVMGGGMGCALIRADVFKALAYPWFEYVTYENGAVLSEDLNFCCKAAAAGFKIYADTRVRCGHVAKWVQYA